MGSILAGKPQIRTIGISEFTFLFTYHSIIFLTSRQKQPEASETKTTQAYGPEWGRMLTQAVAVTASEAVVHAQPQVAAFVFVVVIVDVGDFTVVIVITVGGITLNTILKTGLISGEVFVQQVIDTAVNAQGGADLIRRTEVQYVVVFEVQRVAVFIHITEA